MLERFLPRFNARFRVPAAEPEVAYRPLDPQLPLASILSFRHPRTVARDNTVKYRWRTLQLLPGSRRTKLHRDEGRGGGAPGRRALRPTPGEDGRLARGTAPRGGAEGAALRAGAEPGP